MSEAIKKNITDYRMLPVEPTDEMIEAGRNEPLAGESDEDAPEDYRAVYKAMINAAPCHVEYVCDMVSVPRELLEEIVELHRCRGVVLIIHVEQLAELLAGVISDH